MKTFYRGLLWLYPSSYRREYGAAMVDTFQRRASEATLGNPFRRLRFLAREAGGVLRSAAAERFGKGARHRQSAVKSLVPTGGPAAPRSHRHRRRLDAAAREVGHALRRLRHSPGFTAAAVFTLALGIGGNAAIFAVVNSIVLSPLPYPDADRLVTVAAEVEAVDAHGIEIPISFWLGYRSMNETFDEIGLFEYASVNISGEGAPEHLEAIAATGALFATLGVTPALGRPILEEDEAPGAPLVVVLSNGLWARRYGADATIIGRTIRVDGLTAEVVGVMPAGFAFPRPETQIWFPLTIDRGSDPPISFSYSAIGRMAPGASLESAHQDLSRATGRLPEMFGNITEDFIDEYGVAPWLRPYKSSVIGDIATTMWVLLGSLGFVLLIACANVANLFLVRTEARQRELGVRAALGASRADLVGHMLAESLVIGMLACAVGLGLAAAGVRLLTSLGPTDLPRLEEVGIGATELGFTATVSLLVAVAFGALPILRIARQKLVDQLREAGGRATAGGTAHRATTLLVVGQVSLALLLTLGATLFARSLGNLTRIDPGFDADNVLTFQLSLPHAAYPDDDARALFNQQLVDRLEALPGVVAAGLTKCLPLQGWCGGNPVSSPDTSLPPEAFRDVASIKPVSPGYFRALGMTLERGRAIERRDHEAGTGVAVLSEALAQRLFPDTDALGKRVYPSEDGPEDEADWYTVVGIVGTVKRLTLDEEPADILYVPMIGTDGRFLPDLDEVTVAVKTTSEPTSLAATVRETVWALDDDVPIAAVEPMRAILSRASARIAFTATLIGIAAAAALLLGAVGIYGVVSHTVGQRTAEIGVRMALGAGQAEVRSMVLRQGLGVTAIGIAVGIAGALALARVLRSLLYGVSPEDPLALVAVSAGLLVVATLASYLPARRASRLDPVIALRRD